MQTYNGKNPKCLNSAEEIATSTVNFLLKIICLLGGAICNLQEDTKIQILIPKKPNARPQTLLLMLEN